jgi:hypothetical protein
MGARSGAEADRSRADQARSPAFPGPAEGICASCSQQNKGNRLFAMMQSWILVMRLTIRTSGPRGSTSPSVDELKSESRARLALPEHADKLKSELRWLFDEESLKDTNDADANFYQLIFTPPYESRRTQPSEHLWAYMKNFVASSFCRGRGMPLLRQQVRAGFYGAVNHSAVDADFCHRPCSTTSTNGSRRTISLVANCYL